MEKRLSTGDKIIGGNFYCVAKLNCRVLKKVVGGRGSSPAYVNDWPKLFERDKQTTNKQNQRQPKKRQQPGESTN